MKTTLALMLVVLCVVAGTGQSFGAPAFSSTSKRAAFLSPLEGWMPTWNLDTYVSLLEHAGYQVDVLLDGNVSISFLENGLANYDVIILRTDMFSLEGVNFYCAGDTVTFDTAKQYAQEIALNEISPGLCLGFSPTFVKDHYPPGSIPHGLVYVVASDTASLSPSFISAGSAVFMGYYQDLNLRFGCMDAFSQLLLKYLSNGYTVDESVLRVYAYLNTGHGATATWPSVVWVGDASYTL